MLRRRTTILLFLLGVTLFACADGPSGPDDDPFGEFTEEFLDQWLAAELVAREFDGRVEEEFLARLGRPIHEDRAELGRLLFFDPILSLTGDNSCSGCHGPNTSFNDGNSIAIGVGNNGIVGPGRRGPHNQRRAPTVVNAALYPSLMWDSRFKSLAVDPFDNSAGFSFPAPEGMSLSGLEHLLVAQAFTPVANRIEMAGAEFQGTNDEMRAEVVRRVAGIEEYRTLFAGAFDEVSAGEPIRYEHIAAAIAEFEFTLIRADAPIDRYARGDKSALTHAEKSGARLFFDDANCGECHLVRSFANQMFSDFEGHVLAVPQVVPVNTNAEFDGSGNEDFGVAQQTGLLDDRYKFRTTPLRNVAFQPTFMHNGAYLCLEESIRHHLDAANMVASYNPEGLEEGLQGPVGPSAAMLENAQHIIKNPAILEESEIEQIILFVRNALTDPDAHPERLRHLIPATVPSGLPVHQFQFGTPERRCEV